MNCMIKWHFTIVSLFSMTLNLTVLNCSQLFYYGKLYRTLVWRFMVLLRVKQQDPMTSWNGTKLFILCPFVQVWFLTDLLNMVMVNDVVQLKYCISQQKDLDRTFGHLIQVKHIFTQVATDAAYSIEIYALNFRISSLIWITSLCFWPICL